MKKELLEIQKIKKRNNVTDIEGHVMTSLGVNGKLDNTRKLF